MALVRQGIQAGQRGEGDKAKERRRDREMERWEKGPSKLVCGPHSPFLVLNYFLFVCASVVRFDEIIGSRSATTEIRTDANPTNDFGPVRLDHGFLSLDDDLDAVPPAPDDAAGRVSTVGRYPDPEHPDVSGAG